MKRIYYLPIGLVVILLYFVFRIPVNNAVLAVIYYSPCDYPLAYSIGSIDSRFKMTKEALITDAKIAGNVWSSSINKQLFVYDPKADFTINLVYDSRQELTNKITEMNKDLKEKQGEIDPKLEDYKRKELNFEKRVKALNDQISSWNMKGGAPKEEYDKLIAEQKSLQEEARVLTDEAKALGQATDDYNSNAKNLNQEIDNYQQVLVTKPEEGLYEQDGRKRKISIYIDISHDEFLHTLTHEMGHSLGLDHNTDPKSIMYPQTTQVLTPSEVEIEDLQNICKKGTVFEILFTRMSELVKVIQTQVLKK